MSVLLAIPAILAMPAIWTVWAISARLIIPAISAMSVISATLAIPAISAMPETSEMPGISTILYHNRLTVKITLG